MNLKLDLKIIGKSLLILTGLLMLPLLTAVIYKESVYPFVITIAVSAVLGITSTTVTPDKQDIFAKDGFLIVTVIWILYSAIGALPFYISGEITSIVDAVFETVSGFTTTGSTIINDIESVSKSLLFWRSFTHFIGGMGVLVFIMAILPLNEQHSMHIMRAEIPGPEVGKLVPKSKDTAVILYLIYVILTLIETIILKINGMTLFDALLHSFGTAGTGGFSTKNSSIAYYNSQNIEIIIGVFLILFGINFSLYFLIINKKWKLALKSEELHVYIIIIAVSIMIISISTGFRDAFFNVVSIITTAGFGTADYTKWPVHCQMIIVFLMLCGACAGSTGGGIKISRIIILFKASIADITKTVSPRRVLKVRVEGKPLENSTVSSVFAFTCIYFTILIISTFLISLDGFDFETSLSACISCLSNVGPGLSLIGPKGNFSIFSDMSKIILIIDMLLGRLEFYPVLTTIICIFRKS